MQYRKLLVLCVLVSSFNLYSQRVALKTNVLQWATLSPNLGAELVLSNHLSLNLEGSFNPFRIGGTQLKYFGFQPELRYWLGRPMSRHYVGVTGFLENNDMKWKSTKYYGDAFGGGLTYGYAWILGKHWNLEAFAGLGYIYYRQFKSAEGEKRPDSPNLKGGTLAPVRLGVSFVYILK